MTGERMQLLLLHVYRGKLAGPITSVGETSALVPNLPPDSRRDIFSRPASSIVLDLFKLKRETLDNFGVLGIQIMRLLNILF